MKLKNKKWTCTHVDSYQHLRCLGDQSFECIEIRQTPSITYHVCWAVIDLHFNDELEFILRQHGYGMYEPYINRAIDNVKDVHNDEAFMVMAECVFSHMHVDSLMVKKEGSFQECKDFVLKYTQGSAPSKREAVLI